jgi:hypothetical protein
MTQKCLDTKCKMWMKKAYFEKIKEIYNKKIDELEKDKLKCTSKNCAKIEKQIKIKKALLKYLNVDKKTELQMCGMYYCNEGCKHTIWQDGPANKLPDGLKKSFKKDVMMIKYFTNLRKEMFGKKTSVLKNHFYEKIPAKTLKRIKRQGAISGCKRDVE